MALAAAHPQQGGFGIAAGRRRHQLVQGLQKPGCVTVAALRPPPGDGPAVPSGSAPVRRSSRPRPIVLRAIPVPATPPRRRHGPPRAPRWRRTVAAALVEERRKRIEAGLDRGGVDHRNSVRENAAASQRFLDSFVAFLLPAGFFCSDSFVQARTLSAEKEGYFLAELNGRNKLCRPWRPAVMAIARLSPPPGDRRASGNTERDDHCHDGKR